MKRTTDGRWAHVFCCYWVADACFVDTAKMEPVGYWAPDGSKKDITEMPKHRFRLQCRLRKTRNGAIRQCSSPGCGRPYHPTCARTAGLYMEFEDLGNNQVETKFYCENHTVRNRTNAVSGLEFFMWFPVERVWSRSFTGVADESGELNKTVFYETGGIEWLPVASSLRFGGITEQQRKQAKRGEQPEPFAALPCMPCLTHS